VQFWQRYLARARRRVEIPMRARVVACLLQLATVDLTLRR